MTTAIITRLPDWPARLEAYLVANRDRPFRWGTFDCCLFAANAVREITGVDVAAAYRGRYHTMLGGVRLSGGPIDRVVGEVANQFAILRYGDVRDARPGDVVLADVSELSTLGVVSPRRLPTFVTRTGLVEYPFMVVRAAWGIG